MAAQCAGDQAPGVKHMLRPKVAAGPFGPGSEFQPDKVADIAEDTIAHFAGQLSLRMPNLQVRLKGHGRIQLEARS